MSLIEKIHSAEKNKVAVGHFNIAGLEQFRGISEAVRELNLPAIIGASEGERNYLGDSTTRVLLDSYNKEFGSKDHVLFLNSDHTKSLEKARAAAEAGFDAVLIDGGKLPFEENVALTKSVVKEVKAINKHAIVEGELGYIGSSSKLLDEVPKGAEIGEKDLTTPDEAQRFVKETGVDLLAPAVGNLHGMFKHAPNPRLNIARIKEIRSAAGVPLVLHGGSGISDEDFIAAIQAGVGVIHISTEIRRAWRAALDKSLRENPDQIAPYKIMPDVIEAIKEVVSNRLKLFNNLL